MLACRYLALRDTKGALSVAHPLRCLLLSENNVGFLWLRHVIELLAITQAVRLRFEY